LVLIFVAGFRYHVGGDSLAYEKYFADLPNLSEWNDFDFSTAEYEVSWYILNAISKSIDDSFYVFQIIHAIIINTIIFWFIKKYSENKWLSLLLYFFFNYLYFNMEVLRESLAIVVFLLAVPLLLKRKWIPYFLICFIASSFHSSAYITFLFPFLLRDFKTWQTVMIYLTITLTFLFFTPKDLVVGLGFSGSLERKANAYSTINITLYGYLASLLSLFPFLVIYYIRKRLEKANTFDKLIYIYLILGLIACFIPGFYRFQNYLSIIALIYLADSVVLLKQYEFSTSFKLISFWMMISLIFINQFYYLGRSTAHYEKDTRIYNKYYPYHSIFSPKIEEKRENLYFNSMEK
jgi:hypothetical protein